jgi:hypothetical protein
MFLTITIIPHFQTFVKGKSSGDERSRTAVFEHLVQVFHSGECTYLKSSIDLKLKRKRER